MNVTKAKLEGLFVDELERFQPTPGYMRLLKESVLHVWQDRKASVKNEVASAEQRAKAIQQKLDRLDDAFIFERSIDLDTYERQRDRLREQLTLVEIDRHGSKLEELDVEGILASQSGCYRVLRISGSSRRWSSASGFNNCFSRKAWRSTEKHSIEPP